MLPTEFLVREWMGNLVLQLLANGLVAGSLYALVGSGFALKYRITHFFDFAHGALVAVGAYTCWTVMTAFGSAVGSIWSVGFLLAAAAGVGACGLLGAVHQSYIYRTLADRRISSLGMLIASLGIYVVLQNAISLLAGDAPKVIRPGLAELGISLGGDGAAVRVTGVQLGIVCAASICIVLGSILLRNTMFGRRIRALANDEELAEIRGLNVNGLQAQVHAIGGALAGLAGILWGLDADLRPAMGFPILTLVMAAMVIGGINSSAGVLIGGLLVGVIQSLGAIWVGTGWSDAIIFGVLVIFLMVRPQGILQELRIRARHSQ